ncbi:MAG: hypothetical protein ACRC8Y_02015 [Chroococcales cyanobacterium]
MTYDARTVISTASITATGWNIDDHSEREWQSGPLEELEYPEDATDFFANADEAHRAIKEEENVFDLKGELWQIDGKLVDLVFADEAST